MALNGLICADVPLRIYSLTHSSVVKTQYFFVWSSFFSGFSSDCQTQNTAGITEVFFLKKIYSSPINDRPKFAEVVFSLQPRHLIICRAVIRLQLHWSISDSHVLCARATQPSFLSGREISSRHINNHGVKSMGKFLQACAIIIGASTAKGGRRDR